MGLREVGGWEKIRATGIGQQLSPCVANRRKQMIDVSAETCQRHAPLVVMSAQSDELAARQKCVSLSKRKSLSLWTIVFVLTRMIVPILI